MFALLAATLAAAGPCVDVVPWEGDYELIDDPATGRILLTQNVGQNPVVLEAPLTPSTVPRHGIVVDALSRVTGEWTGEPRARIADTYIGSRKTNGPEFWRADTPGGDLAITFAGPEGVHAAFRPVGAVWDDFTVDHTGAPFPVGEPPVLPTSPGYAAGPNCDWGYCPYHPAGDQGGGVDTHGLFAGPYTGGGLRFGVVDDPAGAAAMVPVGDVMRAGLRGDPLEVEAIAPHPSRSGELAVTACNLALWECGVYLVTLEDDPALGWTVAPYGPSPVAPMPRPSIKRETLRGATWVDPAGVERTVWFAVDDTNTAHAWEQVGGTLVPLDGFPLLVPAAPVEHVRIVTGAGGTAVLVYWQLRERVALDLSTVGTWALGIAADADGDPALRVPPVRVTRLQSVEVIEVADHYAPGVGRWAYYKKGSGLVKRCWF